MIAIFLIIGVIISLLYKSWDIPIIHWLLQTFERPDHIKTFPARGILFIFFSTLILMAFFEKNIVMASLMIWTIGDSISALIGKHYGKFKHPFNDVRLVEGTIAGIIAATLASSIFIVFYKALIASIIAMTLESLELRLFKYPIDDNILVPIISALVLLLL